MEKIFPKVSLIYYQDILIESLTENLYIIIIKNISKLSGDHDAKNKIKQMADNLGNNPRKTTNIALMNEPTVEDLKLIVTGINRSFVRLYASIDIDHVRHITLVEYFASAYKNVLIFLYQNINMLIKVTDENKYLLRMGIKDNIHVGIRQCVKSMFLYFDEQSYSKSVIQFSIDGKNVIVPRDKLKKIVQYLNSEKSDININSIDMIGSDININNKNQNPERHKLNIPQVTNGTDSTKKIILEPSKDINNDKKYNIPDDDIINLYNMNVKSLSKNKH